jgi:hypothetical protein
MISLAVSATYLTAQSADDIVSRSRNRITMKSISTTSRMVIVNKDKSTSERIIKQYSKDDAKRNGRTIIEFIKPTSVAGTRFITFENANGADNMWIFLPSVGKETRIDAKTDGSKPFMSTNFSYNDISSQDRDASLDTHTLLKEEDLNGKACYVIESKPRDKSYQYSKMISWIDKNNSVNYKMELYDNKKGALVKILEMSNFQNVQERLTPRQTKMTTVSDGTSTTIYIDEIKYDDDEITESMFTKAYLKTGKKRE